MIDTEHRFLPRKPGWCILCFKQENLPAAMASPPRTVRLESRSSSLNFLNLSQFSFAEVITVIRPRKEGYDIKVIFFFLGRNAPTLNLAPILLIPPVLLSVWVTFSTESSNMS